MPMNENSVTYFQAHRPNNPRGYAHCKLYNTVYCTRQENITYYYYYQYYNVQMLLLVLLVFSSLYASYNPVLDRCWGNTSPGILIVLTAEITQTEVVPSNEFAFPREQRLPSSELTKSSYILKIFQFKGTVSREKLFS